MTVKHGDAVAVAAALRMAKRDAVVAADVQRGCVVVFDRAVEAPDPAAVRRLGKSLSKALTCPVFAAANEDDDVFRYWLFAGGRAVDAFDSGRERVSEQHVRTPAGGQVVIARFDPDRPLGALSPAQLARWKPAARAKDERGGNAQVLAETLGVPAAAERAMRVLLNDYDVELDRHRALCKVLGLSPWAVGVGYEDVAAGRLPAGVRASQVVGVGSAAPGDERARIGRKAATRRGR
ncbi:MAG TPA: hypothetical protein VF796_26010 [Humisphaera sp.]